MLSVLARAAMAAAARLRAGGLIVNEHTLTPEQMRLHVEALGRWFDFIALEDLPARLLRPGKRPFCLLTFDDGHRSNATMAAPELERLGVPAVFFVTTGFMSTPEQHWFSLYAALGRKLGSLPPSLSPRAVKQLPHDMLRARLERVCREHGVVPDPEDEHATSMSWDQARALRRKGFAIGAHGYTHAVMTRETRADARANIARSIEEVTRELGEPCASFAFPNGNYTADLALHAQSRGARFVFTAEPTWADADFPLWRLPRVQLFSDHDAPRIDLKVAVSALGRFVPNGDGTGTLYAEVNRLARRRAARERARREALAPGYEPGADLS